EKDGLKINSNSGKKDNAENTPIRFEAFESRTNLLRSPRVTEESNEIDDEVINMLSPRIPT
ncbi:hypothetical protein JTP77_043460, partial [Streptomyces sp. S9]|nr:hypothetical protein [Streptomyces sp. S9]